MLAGTSHGIFALVTGDNSGNEPQGPHWVMRSSIVNYGTKIVTEAVNGKRVNRLENITIPAREMSSRVAAFDLSSDVWLVATAEGIFTSKDQGRPGKAAWCWVLQRITPSLCMTARCWRRAVRVSSSPKTVAQTGPRCGCPPRLRTFVKSPSPRRANSWVGAGDGVYFSRDKAKPVLAGESTGARRRRPGLQPRTGRMLVSSRSSQVLLFRRSGKPDLYRNDDGFKLFMARSAAGVRFAASLAGWRADGAGKVNH